MNGTHLITSTRPSWAHSSRACPCGPALAAAALALLGCSSNDSEDAPTLLVSDPAVCETALLCDDFEAQALGAPPSGGWSVVTNNGTVTVENDQARSGSQAARASTPAAAGYKSAMLVYFDRERLPTPENVVYGRMTFLLESAPTTDVHWTFVDGQGTVPGEDYQAIYRYGGQRALSNGNQLMANYETPGFYATPPTGPDTDCYQHGMGETVPVGVWSCLEWMFDGPNASMRLWLDGVAIDSVSVTGTGQGCRTIAEPYTWLAPEFSRLDVGWESYQEDDARAIWIDDVAIATERIGCPAPP